MAKARRRRVLRVRPIRRRAVGLVWAATNAEAAEWEEASNKLRRRSSHVGPRRLLCDPFFHHMEHRVDLTEADRLREREAKK